jgi:hypothetical protein
MLSFLSFLLYEVTISKGTQSFVSVSFTVREKEYNIKLRGGTLTLFYFEKVK